MTSFSRLHRIMVLFFGMILSGCSGRPEPPDQPELSPSLAGQEAIKIYDKSGDGLLDKEELASQPGILPSFDSIDTNKDGKLAATEIEARVQQWLDGATIISGQPVIIELDGKRLEGATVTMEPEPFLKHAIKDAVAITNENGEAYFKGQDSKYPGLYMGFYTLRVSKVVAGKETIPPCYNKESILGKELCQVGDIQQYLLFELKSNP